MAEKLAKTTLNPNVNQVYPIVNDVYQQMTGVSDIKVVDTASLITMGKKLDDLQKKDLWFNTLARRIGMTIDEYRAYTNRFAELYRTQMEWGAIVQKVEAEMPDATEDVSWDIGYLDGKSVDQWIISNPKIRQKFFEKETPYSFFITISTVMLRDAFISESAMASFIRQIFGKVQNKINFTLEELARLAICNFIGNTQAGQEFHTVTIYNSLTGENVPQGIQASNNANYLRWLTGFINNISAKMELMSQLYNAENHQKFTPKSAQKLYMISDLITRMQTLTAYEAFNPQYITSKPDILVPYWQSSGKTPQADWNTITSVKIKNSANVDTTKTNVIAVLFDREALGTFRTEQEVLTTPVNARARYYNTFWHERQLWFNDFGENGVVFYMD